MEVEALDQDPVVVCGQEINEEQHSHLAADLMTKKKKSRLSSHRARTSLFVCLCVDTFFRAQHFTTPVQLRESMMRLHFEAQGGNIKQQQCNNKFMVIKVIKSNGSVDTHFVTALVFG